MEIKGTIIQVLERKEGVAQSGNTWALQPYVLETLEQYPRKVYFEVFGEERIEQNACNVGDEVTVSYDIESREFNAKWYTQVRAWKIDKAGQEAAVAAAPVPDPFAQN